MNRGMVVEETAGEKGRDGKEKEGLGRGRNLERGARKQKRNWV